MSKGDAPQDQSLTKAVEGRRYAEAARKARIFNTRLRVMGLDLDALNQQVKDKQQQENMEKLQQNQEQLHQAAMEEERRKAARIALHSFNQAQAAERAESLKEQHRREETENLAEMWHTMTSDMLTECADAGERDVGGGKPPQILPDRWKGIRPEQLRSFQRDREQQCQQKQKAEEEERRKAEKMRELRIQMDQYNMQLAREQRAQEYLNKKLYTNKPTKDYFYQFNTSSR
uniref:RIB43A-like with coiled-coils protein 1 n=1 Tax=Oryzias latipes TaxID=8090 RepID=A0A3P9KFZ0_ORYLA